MSKSSDPNESQEEDAAKTGTPNKQTDGLDEEKPSVDANNVQSKDGIGATSGHIESKETEKSKSSPESSEIEKSKDSPSPDGSPKKSKKSKSTSSGKGFETSSINSIKYKAGETDLLESVFDNATDKKLIDRLLGCAYGQALGDAYGLSTEFEEREDVAKNYSNPSELIPFPKYCLTGHNRRWKEGDWTDDTDQWILILTTLMFHDGDEKVFAQKLKNWILYGYPELGDHGGMGLGANVSQVILWLSKNCLQLNIRIKLEE